MDKFRAYLEAKDLVPRTVSTQQKHIKRWLQWLPVRVKDSRYSHLMDYIAHLQAAGTSVCRINKNLQAISNYYEFLELPNPAVSIRLRGQVQRTVLRPIAVDKMDDLYRVFEVQKVRSESSYFYHSDRIILGLVIYQALEMGDFMVLKKSHVDLEKGCIYVPHRKQRMSRIIPLESHQILQLHQYFIDGREKTKREASEMLFSPQAEDYHQLHWQFKRLSKHVKKEAKTKLDLNIEKLNHLRQSRIAYWIKQYGLRKTQYLAGFRTIMSVERYQNADMENLKEQVKLHHPHK